MRYFISILLFCYSFNCYSWGQTAHRISGQIAEEFISPETKSALKDIIGNQSLAQVSTYADEQRSNRSRFWQDQAPQLHYVTVPDGKNYSKDKAPKRGDAVTGLNNFHDILLNPKSSKQQKQLALKFIIHIIADLHQPLHVGNGKDRGGNKFRVSFFGKSSNLHRVWDSQLIDTQKLSYTEWTDFLLRELDKEDSIKWQTTDPMQWIAESIEIRQTIYPKNTGLGWQYVNDHLPIVKTRLSQSGVRIAAYLNNIFSSH